MRDITFPACAAVLAGCTKAEDRVENSLDVPSRRDPDRCRDGRNGGHLSPGHAYRSEGRLSRDGLSV